MTGTHSEIGLLLDQIELLTAERRTLDDRFLDSASDQSVDMSEEEHDRYTFLCVELARLRAQFESYFGAEGA